MTTSNPKTRVLLIQHELLAWERARMWGYTMHVGLEEGLEANDLDVTTLFSTWFPRARDLSDGRKFDQVWICDATHMFEPGGCGGRQLQEADLEWIAAQAPIRVGLVHESLEYTPEEYRQNPALHQIRATLQRTIPYMTHVLTPDEKDIPAIQALGGLPTALMIAPVPDRLVAREVVLPATPKSMFCGTAYGERARWLAMPGLKDLLQHIPSAESATNLPAMFDQLHGPLLQDALSAPDSLVMHFYRQYRDAVRQIRRQAYELYLDRLRSGYAVVNLPSYGKIHTARVYEGMAVGRPVVTMEIQDRPRLARCFRPGQDLLVYPKEDPQALVQHLRQLIGDRDYARQIAASGNAMLRQYHTSEKRIGQILHWIRTGQEMALDRDGSVNPVAGHSGNASARSLTTQLSEAVPAVPAPAAATAAWRPLRVLFISPPFSRFLGLQNARFPLTFGAMATLLAQRGHTARIYDADFDPQLLGRAANYEFHFTQQHRVREALENRQHPVWREVEETLRTFKPEVIGLTTMTSKFPMVVRIAEMAKAIDPRVRVVIGGHHASVYGERLLDRRDFDFAVVGEGEFTMRELVDGLAAGLTDFSGIAGLIYRRDGHVISTPPRPLLTDLDQLPLPDRALMLNAGYVSENNLIASRGCPYHCSYCGADVIWQHKVRRRSVPKVLEEVRDLIGRSGSRHVNFWDDSFTHHRKYIQELMAGLRQIPGLTFSCITRLDLVDRPMLELLKASGCVNILFGIESGNDRILKLVNKGTTRDKIKAATALVDAVGIPWIGFFIMGYPGESRETVLQTLEFMRELNPPYAEINLFNPLPGTPVWNDLVKQGSVQADMDFSRCSQASTEHSFMQNMSPEEFRDLALMMAREFDRHNARRAGAPAAARAATPPAKPAALSPPAPQGAAGATRQLPGQVHFLLNDKCNAKCVMCGGDYFRSQSGRKINLEKFTRMARNLKLERFRGIVLAGWGDPLLNPDLLPIVQWVNAQHPGLIVSITTNGIALSPELSRALLRQRIDEVNISINSATRKTYKRIMQVDCFDQVCQNVRTLARLKREAGAGPVVQFSSAINRLNIEELPTLVELAAQLGVNSLNLMYCRFYPERIRQPNLSCPENALKDEHSLFFHQELSDAMVVKAKQMAARLGLRLMHEPLFGDHAPARPCGWTEASLMVGFDGEVYPCGGAEVHMREKVQDGVYHFGNALQESIDEFWNSDHYRALRVSARQGPDGCIAECRHCANLMAPNELKAHIMHWDEDAATPAEVAPVAATAPAAACDPDPDPAVDLKGALSLVEQRLGEAGQRFGQHDLEGSYAATERAAAMADRITARIYSSLGSLQYERQHFDEARAAFQRSLLLVPDQVSTLVQWAVTALRLDRVDEFESALGRALAVDPGDFDALRVLGDLHLQQGGYADAAKSFAKILQRHPDHVGSLLSLGRCFYELEDFDTARAAFERVLEVDPNHVMAKENLAVVRRRQTAGGSPIAVHPAESPLPGGRSGTGVAARSAQIVSPNFTSMPDAARLALQQADAHFAEGRLAEAVASLEQALAHAPLAPELWVTHGSVLYQREQFELACQSFNRAAVLLPQDPDIHLQIAMAALKLDRIEEFEAAMARALQLDAQHPAALRFLANLHYQQQNWAEAAAIYDRLWKRGIEDADMLAAFGVCLHMAGDRDASRRCFERALALNPNHEAAGDNLKQLSGPSTLSPDPVASPLVSVIVPTHNRPDMLPETLRSILGQTFRDFEIIVVNDAGPDVSALVRSLNSAGTIRYVQHDRNRGLAAARNTGIREARGQFIAYLDDDDIFLPDHLQTLVDCLREHPGFEVAYTDAWRAHQVRRGDGYQIAGRDVPYSFDFDRERILRENFVPVLCFMHERSCWEAVGGFDESLPVLEDWDLWIRLSRRFRFQHVARVTCEFRWRTDGSTMTLNRGDKFPRARQAIAEKIGRMLAQEARAGQDAPAVSVSVIVLAFNQIEHTRKCLASLQAHCPAEAEFIVVDNGSTDGTGDYLRDLGAREPRLIVIENRGNRGFAAGNNQGLAVARGRFLVLLNNDTVVTQGWLDRLRLVFEKHPDAGLAGPVSNCVSGPQQVKAAEYRNLEEMPAFAARWMADHQGQSEETLRLVGFCLMLRREVVARIGGLDEQFGSGNFEDDDYCLRAALAGFKARIAKDIFIHHTGSQTFKGARIDFRQSMLRNWALFKAKWGLPAETTLEQGYRLTQVPKGLELRVALKPVADDHREARSGRWWEETGTPSLCPAPAQPAAGSADPIPKIAEVGRLKTAYECLHKKQYGEAWRAGLAALAVRPFHPEAFVMLGETALGAGDAGLAKQCARRASEMAPGFDLAKKLLKQCRVFKGMGKQRVAATRDWPPLPAAGKPRLSVCLIVRNEEKFMEPCLNSVKGLASQIVVVDTGSTDRTVELAKSLGAEVHHFAWNDNFSDARNAALERVTGDWVLVLDADEDIPASEHPRFVAAMNQAGALGYRLPIREKGREATMHSYVPRLFRNAPGLFFVGRIHEQIFPSVLARCQEWGLTADFGQAAIVHHGYSAEMIRSRQKVDRNLRLLQQAVLEDPDDPNMFMQLGTELTRSGREAEGLRSFYQALNLVEKKPQGVVIEMHENLLTQLGLSLLREKQYAELLRVFNLPVARRHEASASMHYLLGLAHRQLEQYGEAAHHLERCLALRDQPSHAPVIEEVLTVASRHCLADCLVRGGYHDRARAAFEAALQESPSHRPLRVDYARLWLAQNEPVKALEVLHALVEEKADEAAVWELGGRAALSRPEFLEFALDWTEEALRHFPDHPVVIDQRAEVLLLSQQTQVALALWRRAKADPREVAATVMCQLGGPDETNPDSDRLPWVNGNEVAVSREFIAWYRRLLQYQAVEVVKAVHGRLPDLRQVLPTAGQLLEGVVNSVVQE